ncbi:MAG: homogentisate 1,2-dioxygenase [Aquabacterium sp.]
MTLQCLSGFGNSFATEAVPGALPQGRNSPQRVPHGLYAEVLSGTAFTAPRADNRRTWFYRRRPSVVVGGYAPMAQPLWCTGAAGGVVMPPDPLRWHPVPMPAESLDFIEGMRTMVANGGPDAQHGLAAHLCFVTRAMGPGRAFVNADGEMLLIPQAGSVTVVTECGRLQAAPGEIVLVPRGMAMRVDVDGPASLYVAENYGAAFRLPELGPIGSNGLANARDFLAPVAAFEDAPGRVEMVKKVGGAFWRAEQGHSPFDVVAWHGNLAPLKYDLRLFNTIGSISYDHPDPSIFTVLTSPSETPGTANCDFVIFPPRWLVAEDTFRPPWYHRNVMAEFMGLVYGQYDAKPEGFRPGGASLHNTMVPHGPDTDAFARASAAALAPHKLDHTMAFMLESRWRYHPTAWAMRPGARDDRYADCWAGLADHYNGPTP